MALPLMALGLLLVASPVADDKKPQKKPNVDLPADGAVKADPKPKPNPAGQKVEEYKPKPHLKPAKEPPPPKKS